MTTRPALIRRPASAVRALALAAVAAAVVAVAVIAGIAAGRSVTPRETVPAAPRVVQTGPARLALPAEWRPTLLNKARVRGLDPRSAVALEPYPGSLAWVVATFAPADDESLIPGALRDLLGGPPSSPVATQLRGWPAWHYLPQLTRGGSRTVEVTVLPTTRGVLAVACLSPVGVLEVDCASAVAAVSVADAAPLVPSRSLALALRMPAVLRPLDRARVAWRTRLARAGTPAAQAAIARRLARAYSSAAASLSGQPGAALRAQLRRAARAYGALGAAASARAIGRFKAARADVNTAERGLAAALARLRAATAP